MKTEQQSSAKQTTAAYDVVILGAGYGGVIAALRLGRRKWGLRIALVNPRDELERVRLQESIVAAVAPRIPSISAFFAGTNVEFICGSVTSLEADQRRIRITTDTQEREIVFEEAIYALGSHVDPYCGARSRRVRKKSNHPPTCSMAPAPLACAIPSAMSGCCCRGRKISIRPRWNVVERNSWASE